MTQQTPSMVIEQAWSRIGRSSWDQMAWFTKLTNTNLDTLSPGDLRNWQDEFQAMEEVSPHGLTAPPPEHSKRFWKPDTYQPSVVEPPSLEEMKEVQGRIAPHLNDIADGQTTQTPNFEIKYLVTFRKTTTQEERTGMPRYQVMRTEHSAVSNWYDIPLHLRVVRLLEQFVDSIRRCPHCQKIFLQSNRNARYCSRSCHSVAGMRLKRAEERKQKAQKKPKMRSSAKTRRKEQPHGQKKR